MDDEQAVLDAVSDVLSKEGWLRSATGRLREYRELFASTDASVAVAPDTWAIHVKTLAIVRMTQNTAVVDLDATRHYETTIAGGEKVPVVQHYTGPVEVVREPDGWKVGNLIANGVSLADSVSTSPDLAGSVAGVEISVLGWRTYAKGMVQMVLEVRNGLPSSLPITGRLLGRLAIDGRWRWEEVQLALAELPAGTTRLDLVGLARDVAVGDPLRLLLRTDAGLIDVRPPSTPATTRLPLLPQARPLVWTRLPFVITLAIAAAFGVAVDVGAAAALLLLAASGYLPRRRAGWRRVSSFGWGLALLAAAIPLLLLGGFRGDFSHLSWDAIPDWVVGTVLIVSCAAGIAMKAALQTLVRRRSVPGLAVFLSSWAILVIAFGLLYASARTNAAPTSQRPASLLTSLPGTRTKTGDLILDETAGSFAGLRLGMSLAAVKNAMPAANFAGAQVKGDDLSYCNEPDDRRCRPGIDLQIIGSCELNACLTATPGPVAEITLNSIGDPRKIAGAHKAVTLRGVRLGTPVSDIEHDYKITEVGGLICGAPVASPGKTYVAIAGNNTVEFTSHRDIIWAITLLAGKHPHPCRS